MSKLAKLKTIFDSYEVEYKNIYLNNFDSGSIPEYSGDFLHSLLTDLNYNYQTYCGSEMVTDKARGRSVGEVFYLIKNYYVDYSFEQYIKDILYSVEKSFRDKKGGRCICVWFCGCINLPVFRVVTFYKENIDTAGYNQSPIKYQHPSKYFNLGFVTEFPNLECDFWDMFVNDEFIKEIVGDKYVAKSN